jgi:hypothetical protein
MNYTITLTETEDKALSTIVFSQDDWIQNVVHERCRLAIDEIVKIVVTKCLETGTSIPNSKEAMVALGFENGWVIPAKDHVIPASDVIISG